MNHFKLCTYFYLLRYFCLGTKGKENDNLSSLRHAKWEQVLMTRNEIDPAVLPPTARATYFHSLRVHIEIARAVMLDIDCELNPCD